VKVEVKGPTGTITLYRPTRGNAISSSMGNELVQAVKLMENDPKVRVVVLTGSGKYFCTGMDLGQSNQQQVATSLEHGSGASSSLMLFESLRNCKKPVIARINGPALGGGFGLVFTSDVRIVAKSAWFWFAEVKRGIVPALISAYIVPQIGPFQAKHYMMTGGKISAEKALELGFVNCVVDDDKLDQVTNEYVEELVGSAPAAMAVVKSTVDFVAHHTHEQNLEHVQKVFNDTVHSPEAMYGMGCFVQKKKPDWSEFAAKL